MWLKILALLKTAIDFKEPAVFRGVFWKSPVGL